MRVWTEEEATLMAWKKKLHDLYKERKNPGKRDGLRNELIKILEADESVLSRSQKFEARRKELLSDNHNQGWDWLDKFSGLSSFLRYFLPNRILNLQKGSMLRQALINPPATPDSRLLSKEDTRGITIQSLSDSDFEKCLFYNTKNALTDLYNRVDLANIKTSSGEINRLLKRLKAIKNRLDPLFYYDLMRKLYEIAPIEATSFFAENYIADPDKEITVLNFMECFLLANQLVKSYVDQHQDQNIQLYHGQEILTLLSMDDDCFTEISKNTFLRRHDTPPQIVSPALLQLADKMRKRGETPFPFVLQALQQKLGIKETIEGCPADTLTLLKSLYDNNRGKPTLLVIHFARQLAERLLSNFQQNQRAEKAGADKNSLFGVGTIQNYTSSIRFISERIFLNPEWSEDFLLDGEFLSLHHYPQPSFIPPAVATAETLAVRFIQIIKEGQTSLLECIRKAHCEDTRFDDFTQKWVLARLEQYFRPEDRLFKQAKHALLHPIVYKYRDFARLFSLPNELTQDQEELEAEIILSLEKAVEANNELKYEKEKEAVKDVITNLYKYIINPHTTTACLQKALDIFIPKLNKYHYLDHQLFQKLNKLIIEKNTSLIRAQYDQIPELQSEDNINYLNQCNLYLTSINTQLILIKPCLCEITENARAAIQCFARAIKQGIAETNLEKAHANLRKLEPYIPKKVLRSWSELINLPSTPAETFSHQLSMYAKSVAKYPNTKLINHFMDEEVNLRCSSN